MVIGQTAQTLVYDNIRVTALLTSGTVTEFEVPQTSLEAYSGQLPSGVKTVDAAPGLRATLISSKATVFLPSNVMSSSLNSANGQRRN